MSPSKEPKKKMIEPRSWGEAKTYSMLKEILDLRRVEEDLEEDLEKRRRTSRRRRFRVVFELTFSWIRCDYV